jgi:hypothetical protein
MHHNGVDLSPLEIVVHNRGDAIYNWTADPSRWSAMSLAHDDLAAAGRAILGHDREAPRRTYVARPAGGAMTHLRTIHNAACKLARSDPSAFSRSTTVKALEQELVCTLVTCLAGPISAAARIDRGQHAKIVTRFEEFLRSRQSEPVYLAEICAAIGVSDAATQDGHRDRHRARLLGTRSLFGRMPCALRRIAAGVTQATALERVTSDSA